MIIEAINPATNKVIRSYNEMSHDEVEQILEKTHQAYLLWKEVDFSKRAQIMKKCAQILRNHLEEYSRLMTEEMGKPIVQSRAEIEKCASVCDFYAENAKKFLTPQQKKCKNKL